MNATQEIFDTDRVGDVLVLTPRRDLREFEYREIQRELLPLVDDPNVQKVVVDLGHTDYLGSTALGMLTLLCQRVAARGGHVAFCNISAHETEILQVVGLNTYWPIFRSREEALQAVA